MTSSDQRAAGSGLFITFEGPEGGGKTTQIARLAERLSAAGSRVVTTREPGGTPAGERIRQVLLDPDGGPLEPATEVFLFNAARTELVSTVIRPALTAGAAVLCDRYADATLAYQGYGRGLDLEILRATIRLATGGLVPDLTLLLDLPPDIGLARRHADRSGGGVNRLDAESLAFHATVREGYHHLAAADPARWHLLDATQPSHAVADAIWACVARRLVVPAPG